MTAPTCWGAGSQPESESAAAAAGVASSVVGDWNQSPSDLPSDSAASSDAPPSAAPAPCSPPSGTFFHGVGSFTPSCHAANGSVSSSESAAVVATGWDSGAASSHARAALPGSETSDPPMPPSRTSPSNSSTKSRSTSSRESYSSPSFDAAHDRSPRTLAIATQPNSTSVAATDNTAAR